jgi:hypothetical protein
MRKSHAVLLASVALCVSFAPLPLTTDTFAFPSINHQVIHAAAVSPHQTASATPKLPVAVDGSQTPEAIPLPLAYRHLLLSLAASDGSVGSERRDRQFKAIGLSEDDRKAVEPLLATLRNTLEGLDRTRRVLATHPASDATLNALQTQEHQALDAAQEQLRQLVTPRGADLVDAYVRGYVRARIVVYSSMPSGL